MTVKVFITIDTEEDLWDAWAEKDNPVANVTRIPLVQRLFDRFGAIPTYLIGYPVVRDIDAAGIIKEILDKGRCGIGTHCHPWNTPPLLGEEINDHNTMICNLPPELQYRKIQTLHEEIVDRFNVNPICFRAGRWGFDAGTAQSIHDLGYRIDTSVTPFYDWTDKQGPDFSEVFNIPYYFRPHDVRSEDPDGPILEVPATIGFLQSHIGICVKTRRLLGRGGVFGRKLARLLDRLGLLNLRWLSPESSTGPEMIRLSESLVRSRHSCLNISFHSVSLLPGKGPYVRNDHDLEVFLHRIEVFLRFAVDKGFEFLPLDEVLEEERESEAPIADQTDPQVISPQDPVLQ